MSFEQTGFSIQTMMSPQDMAARREELVAVASEPSPLFTRWDNDKQRCSRNRHLDSRAVLELACHPNVLGPMASIFGPDLVLWRSDFVIQGSGDPATMWHQDRQFSGRRRLPSLLLPDAVGGAYDEDAMRGHIPVPRSISAWVAISDTDREHGCVMVVEGSNREGVIPVRKSRPDESSIFGKGTVLDYDIPEDRVRYMEIAAGQYFLFDRLTLHASVPTRSAAPRIGITLRYTSPDVMIYPGYEIDSQGFLVSEYKALLVSGEDRFHRNDHVMQSAAERRAQLLG